MSQMEEKIKKIKKQQRFEKAKIEEKIEYYENMLNNEKYENKNEIEKKIKKLKKELDSLEDNYNYKLQEIKNKNK